MSAEPVTRHPVHLAPGEGRRYEKDPHTDGPGAHTHPEDDVFYVLDDTMTFLVGDRWIDAPRGSFVLAPGGVPHDFRNWSRAHRPR